MDTENMPLVSVVMPSYNHAKFITEAINSVLNQTFPYFELIITDDGSADNSVEEIKKIEDPRIKLHVFEKNKGACDTLSYCIQQATTPYIALINSDDVWLPQKLERQYQFMQSNPHIGAVFAYPEIRKEDLSSFPYFTQSSFDSHFAVKNRTQAEWVRTFFNGINYLCHPSILIRRECYEKLGFYDKRFHQLPDFLMWTKLCKHYPIHIIPEKLILFRFHGKNTSAPNKISSARSLNEGYLINRGYLDDIDMNLFKEAFSDLIINKNFSSPLEFECEKAFLFLNHAPSHRFVGIEKLYQLLGNNETRKVLKENYNFDEHDFIKSTGKENYFGINKPLMKRIISKTKRTWSYFVRRIQAISLKFPQNH